MKKKAYFPVLSIVLLSLLVLASNVRAAPPIARNDARNIAEGASLTVLAPGVLINDEDPEGGALTVTTTPISAPTHGNVALNSNGGFTYIHDGSETTSDSFVYQVCDTEELCEQATVTITVVPVNDPPTPANDTASVAEGGTVSASAPGILANDQDEEGDNLQLSPTPVSAPAHGNLTLNSDGSYSYTHDGSETTSDSFVYQVCDDGTPSLCANATVTLNVTPVNDPPQAIDDEGTVAEGGVLNVPAPGVLDNDEDPDASSALKVDPTTPLVLPQRGNVVLNSDGSYTYTHNGSETTSDSFRYRVCDNGTPKKCAEATVMLTIEPVNDAPMPVNDTVTVAEGATVFVDAPGVLVNDTDAENDVLMVSTTPVGEPTHGLVTLQATGAFSYTHDGGETTTDSFIYEVCDDHDPAACSQATVAVTITAVNDAPTIDLNGPNGGGTGFTVPFAVNGGPVHITDLDLDLVDPDDTQLTSATVDIVNIPDGENELLSVNTGGTNISASYNAQLGELTLSGTDSLDNYRQVLRSVTYNNSSPAPNTAARNINFIVNDGETDSNIATAVVTLIDAKIAIAFDPAEQDVNAGDTAQFTVIITNTGNVALTNVTVVNTLVESCNRDLNSVAAGATQTYSCESPNVVNSFLNQAQVTGRDPLNSLVFDNATAFVNVNNPVLDVIILPPNQDVDYNGTANFTIGIINQSSNVPLENIEVTIPEAPDCDRSFAALAADSDTGYSCSLANVTSEVVLVATVVATNANNDTTITASDFATVQVFDMVLTLTADPTELEQPGGTVQYAVTVINQSSEEELTLDSLLSEPYGNVANADNPLLTATSCATGVTIGIRGGSYTCAFEVELMGQAGAYVTSLTAVSTDTSSRTLIKTADATVQIIHNVYTPFIAYERRLDEPNNNICQAYHLDLNEPEAFFANDRTDWYTFALPTAGDVTIKLTDFAPADGLLEIVTGSCTTQIPVSSHIISSKSLTIEMGTQEAGDYFIRLINFGELNNDDPYTLEITVE